LREQLTLESVELVQKHPIGSWSYDRCLDFLYRDLKVFDLGRMGWTGVRDDCAPALVRPLIDIGPGCGRAKGR
jgi:hypothetical protein